jgi:hypothetical protein
MLWREASNKGLYLNWEHLFSISRFYSSSTSTGVVNFENKINLLVTYEMVPLGLSCRGGSCMSALRVHSLDGGALEGMRPRVFPNFRRTHEYKTSPSVKGLSFYFLPSFSFHRKEIFPWEHENI